MLNESYSTLVIKLIAVYCVFKNANFSMVLRCDPFPVVHRTSMPSIFCNALLKLLLKTVIYLLQHFL